MSRDSNHEMTRCCPKAGAPISSERTSSLAWLFLTCIWLYRRTLKHYCVARGVTCLHYPTCSEYARLALHKYPVLTALRLAWSRYHDCNPFSGRPYLDPP